MKKFTTSCFIRQNTPDIRKELDKMGWMFVGITDEHERCDAINCCVGEVGCSAALYFIEDNPDYLIDNFPNTIDCGTNERLFLALSAHNSTYDYLQWFTDGTNWILCTDKKFGVYWSTHQCTISLDTVHKATVEELINHFNKQ